MMPHSFHGLQSTFLRPIQSFAFGIVSRFEFQGLASRDRWPRAGRGAWAGGAGPGSDSGPAPTTDRTRAPWRARSGHALRSRYIFTCTRYQARYKLYHLPYQCRAAAYLVVTHLNPKRCNPQHRNTLLIG